MGWLKKRSKKNIVDEYISSFPNYCNPDYPILIANRSPNSRVPCIDITPFVVDRLLTGDQDSVFDLMRRVISAGPGLGLSAEWINEPIKQILGAPFERYVEFEDSQRAFANLRAVLILHSKEGHSKRGFAALTLTGEFPQQLAETMVGFGVRPKRSLPELSLVGNALIDQMVEDLGPWAAKPAIPDEFLLPEHMDTETARKFRELRPMTRLHLLHIARIGAKPLYEDAHYQIRSYGFDTLNAANELQAFDLVSPATGPNVISLLLDKGDLLNLGKNHGIKGRSKMNKQALSEAIHARVPEVAREMGRKANMVEIAPAHRQTLDELQARADASVGVFRALVFA